MDTLRYFSKDLQSKLEEMVTASVTVVEAPAGYGKTTAIRKAFADFDKKQVFYFTAVREEALVSYHRLCTLIYEIDPEMGQELLDLGLPNRTNSEQIGRCLRNIQTDQETWIVLDNLHYLERKLDISLLKVFSDPLCPRLHIVLITQLLSRHRYSLFENPYLNTIKTSDFSLRAPEIADFFSQHGIQLSEQEAKEIHLRTEGWAVAVAFLLRCAIETGEIDIHRNIDEILYKLFWEKLSPSEKLSLLPLAIFESLSPQMLNLLWERETAEAQIVPLFRRTPLVQFDEMQNRFFVHTILQEFLKRILESEAESTRKEIYQNSGRLYMKMNRQDLAIGCFYAVSDYESILKTNLELLEFSDFQGVGFYEIAGEILENCPPSIKKKYPLSLLKLAYYSYNSMLMDQYDLLMKEAHEVIWEEDEMHNRGEWHLMAAFYHFPDLDLIEKDYEETARFLDGPSRIFTKKFPYLFGCASLWGMFYNKIGQGEEIGEKLTQVLDQYNRLTNGHAAGADVLFKGEHASMQCRYSEARMYAYEAMYLAEQHQNVTVAYGSALLLGRVGFATIGLAGLDEAISYLETRASTFPFMQQSETNHTMLAIVRCLLFTMLNQESEALEKTNFLLNKQSRPSFATWFVSYRKVTLLMAALEFEQALGYLKSLYQQESPIHSPGVSMILLIGMSFCYMALSKFEFATEAMEQAIAIAKPDKLVITFVQFRAYLKPLLMQPQLLEEHGEFIESIFSQEVTFATDPEEVYVAIQKSSLPANLTNRESEVAELVAQGLQNKEIASRLYISQSTVKNHLQSIYTKLDIDRRSQLTNLLR